MEGTGESATRELKRNAPISAPLILGGLASVGLICIVMFAAVELKHVNTASGSRSGAVVPTPAWAYPVTTVEPGVCLTNTMDQPWSVDRISEFSTRMAEDDQEGWHTVDPKAMHFFSAFVACLVSGDDATFATYLSDQIEDPATMRQQTAVGLPDPVNGRVTIARVRGETVTFFGNSGWFSIDLSCAGACVSDTARLLVGVAYGPPYRIHHAERTTPAE